MRMFFSFMIADKANVNRDEEGENKRLHQPDKNFEEVKGNGNYVSDQTSHFHQ